MATKKTSIGGQALIEGIMMKGPYKTTMAVRKKDKTIELVDIPEKHLRDKCKVFGWPIIRGMVNLIEAMVTGYKTMMQSADISGFTDIEDEKASAVTETAESEQTVEAVCEKQEVIEETENTDNKDNKDNKKNGLLMGVVMTVAAVLGVVLAVVLFMYLPSLAFKGLDYIVPADLTPLKGLIEGILKIAIFVGYIALISFEKDIKRVFMYHGAEHKSIFCYESGKELTVENVREFKRFHPRCGTSFMFLMLGVGIVISSVLVFVLPPVIVDNNFLWVPLKILLLPLTCGLGYELIKICGKHENVVTRIISAPGLWVQRLTTKEPDDEMIEVAIAALCDVIPEDGSDCTGGCAK